MIEFVKNFWCQKVLPLVYTDALSYYEMLGKFVSKLNEIIGNVNNLNKNTVFSVNGIVPTDGNVNVGTVKSVNGSMPDERGNVNLPQVSGVTSVDGVVADSSGNVPLNAVKSVNGITPTDGNVNVGTVKSVNDNAPDIAGNVNVGTVKSVNGNTPDSAGNVNAGTVKKVNGVEPIADGSVTLTAANINAVKDVTTSGESPLNTEYFNGTPSVRWWKRGQVVTISAQVQAKMAVGDGNILASGLPVPYGVGCLLMLPGSKNNDVVGITINSEGQLTFGYFNATVVGAYYNIMASYIAAD